MASHVPDNLLSAWVKRGLINASYTPERGWEADPSAVSRLLDLHRGNTVENFYRVLRSPAVSEADRFTCVSLFAGGGGSALGFENAGFRHVAVNEYDTHALKTLHANRGTSWNIIPGDIGDIDFSHLRDTVDVVEGGFPCQAFSHIGKRAGFSDPRGGLFFEFVRAIDQIRPKIIVGENVRGLEWHDGGDTLRVMIGEIEQLGYRVEYRVLRSQFFDVPQKRERMFLCAVRTNTARPILFPRPRPYVISLGEALDGVPESAGAEYSQKVREIISHVPAGGCWKDLPQPLRDEVTPTTRGLGGGSTGLFRRLSMSEPSLTLLTSPKQRLTQRCHPEHDRPLTVREYARVQTFPDQWVFPVTTAQAYKQIGNAVPVNMAFHIGCAVRAMLTGENTEQFDQA